MLCEKSRFSEAAVRSMQLSLRQCALSMEAVGSGRDTTQGLPNLAVFFGTGGWVVHGPLFFAQ